ncbi:protein-L-isoaspartate O-methyltransferase [Mesorhizobium sp. CAU 1741]|uniref:protein-L-isoaspartate O-methyltransferase family protein n=1 Tax=Mesorhizobium sp. CAU 1741 TaxID=3140366 RepID=UPI00325BC91D
MTVDFQELRVKMVDGQLRTTDVTNVDILTAMLALPREDFVPHNRRELAYIDEDILVAPAQDGRGSRYLMEPSPFARLVQLADIRRTDHVLDVACGTGYSSAVLSRVAGSVVGLESHPELVETATRKLADGGFTNVEVVEGVLVEGCPSRAPYDVILINGAVEEVPEVLFEQLKDGGRLVSVVGHGNAARAMFHIKEGGLVSARRAFNAAVMPLEEFRRAPAFEF